MSFTQRISLLFFVLLGAAACHPDNEAPALPLTGVLYESNFPAGTDNWKADFADYSTANGDLQLRSDWTTLPKPLDTTRRSILLSGMNRSSVEIATYWASTLAESFRYLSTTAGTHPPGYLLILYRCGHNTARLTDRR